MVKGNVKRKNHQKRREGGLKSQRKDKISQLGFLLQFFFVLETMNDLCSSIYVMLLQLKNCAELLENDTFIVVSFWPPTKWLLCESSYS